MYITEIVTMKILAGISEETFTRIIFDLEKNYHARQIGFVDSELLFNSKKNEWILIQHWDSMKNLKQASAGIFHDPSAKDFLETLVPQSVKMTILPQLLCVPSRTP